jgi:hypothetical protein
MVSDYVWLKFNINTEEFKAVISKYGLLNAEEVKGLYEQIVDTVIELTSKLDGNEQQ